MRSFFIQKCFFSFCVLTVRVCNFWQKEIGLETARKILLKLTTEWSSGSVSDSNCSVCDLDHTKNSSRESYSVRLLTFKSSLISSWNTQSLMKNKVKYFILSTSHKACLKSFLRKVLVYYKPVLQEVDGTLICPTSFFRELRGP